jgi:hypothetical protein
MTSKFELRRDPFGKLVLTTPRARNSSACRRCAPSRCRRRRRGISLVRDGGKEVGLDRRLEDLPPAIRALVPRNWKGANSCPRSCRSTACPASPRPAPGRWQTDRGDTEFVLKGEEDIRRLGAYTLLIADSHGIHFLIRDMFTRRPDRQG